VKQFARIAQHTGFAYCHGIIESNRRALWSTPATPVKGALSVPPTPTGGIRRAGPQVTLAEDEIEADLNAFFPFDPYKLSRSHTYLDGIYREWRMVAIEDREESDDEEDEVDDTVTLVRQDEENEDEEARLGASFTEMSITSPIRRLDVAA
jgi:RNA polymerase I-specific transcription initiation factor RRN3